MRDIVIAGLGVTDLQGLENIGTFGDELSIQRNPQLVTLRHLGLNLPGDYRTSIRNIEIRDNERLADMEGLRYIQTVDGKFDCLLFVAVLEKGQSSETLIFLMQVSLQSRVATAC